MESNPVFMGLLTSIILTSCWTIRIFEKAAVNFRGAGLKLADQGDQVGCVRCIPCEMGNAPCMAVNTSLRNCVACDYRLEKLEGTVISAFNTTNLVASGKTNTFVYRIVPSGEGGPSSSTSILVKISCLPYYKLAYLKRYASKISMNMLGIIQTGEVVRKWSTSQCNMSDIHNNIQMELSVLKIAHMCEIDHLFPEMGYGPVRGKMPETGYSIQQDGLFMKEAEGLALRTAQMSITDDDVARKFFTEKINSSQVVEAAIFDLLTRQKDRNDGNIFVAENGNIMLIDNNFIGNPLVRSVLLPSTSYHAKMILGDRFLHTFDPKDRNKYPPPGARMDYRCHTKGPIGKNYPPGLKKCMEHIKATPLHTLSDSLGIGDTLVLSALQQSARLLLDKGFEWTLVNTARGRFMVQDPCCAMVPVTDSFTGATAWSCGAGWHFNNTII